MSNQFRRACRLLVSSAIIITVGCARDVSTVDPMIGVGGSAASGGSSPADASNPPVTGSCDPDFCRGGCCLTANGPCGILVGLVCEAPPPCEPAQCPTQFGQACCAAGTGDCGIDLGQGCVAQAESPAPPPPPPNPGDPVPLYGDCGLPPDPGSCDGTVVSYAWVPVLRACAPFTFGGCDGNANRFDTEAACLSQCGRLERIGDCSCAGDASACDAKDGCSMCPAHFALDPDVHDMSCSTAGLHCDSGAACGVFCDCVHDNTGRLVWACASRLC